MESCWLLKIKPFGPCGAEGERFLWIEQESRESREGMYEDVFENEFISLFLLRAIRFSDSLVQLFLNDNSWQERAKRTANLIQDILLILGNEVVA